MGSYYIQKIINALLVHKHKHMIMKLHTVMTWWHSRCKNPEAGLSAAMGVANTFIVVSHRVKEMVWECTLCVCTCGSGAAIWKHLSPPLKLKLTSQLCGEYELEGSPHLWSSTHVKQLCLHPEHRLYFNFSYRTIHDPKEGGVDKVKHMCKINPHTKRSCPKNLQMEKKEREQNLQGPQFVFTWSSHLSWPEPNTKPLCMFLWSQWVCVCTTAT